MKGAPASRPPAGWRLVITINGSTGMIGSELVRLLSKAGEPAIAGTTRLFLLTDNQQGFAKLPIEILRAAESHVTMDEARSQLESKGVPRNQIDAMLALSAYQKAGGPTAVVSDAVARILGSPPRTIREFFQDHASAFVKR